MKAGFAVVLVFTFLVEAAFAEAVQVPARANPWLAGMTNGSIARRGDSAPDESAVQVTNLAVEGLWIYTFSASGSVNHGHPLPFFPPDGEGLVSHYLGTENGIADVAAPFTSLIGVFLGANQPNRSPAPQALEFGTAAQRDYLVLSPALKQPFFIGDGLTSSGVVQQVVAPPGATRLLLGVMDEYRWSDNEGVFAVEVTKVGTAPSIQLSLRPSMNPTDADAVAYPTEAAPSVTAAPTTSTSVSDRELRIFTAIELVWFAEANRLYQVQWTPSLNQPQWINIGPAILGSGSDLSVFDSTRNHPQGFYRVQILP